MFSFFTVITQPSLTPLLRGLAVFTRQLLNLNQLHFTSQSLELYSVCLTLTFWSPPHCLFKQPALPFFLRHVPGSFYQQALLWSYPCELELWTPHSRGSEVWTGKRKPAPESPSKQFGRLMGWASRRLPQPYVGPYPPPQSPPLGSGTEIRSAVWAGQGWEEGITKDLRKLGEWVCLLSWKWWCYDECEPMSRFIKLYTLNICHVHFNEDVFLIAMGYKR